MPIIFQTQTAGNENANAADENNLLQTWPDWAIGGGTYVFRQVGSGATDVNNAPGQLEITVEATPSYTGNQVIHGLNDFDNMLDPDNQRIQFAYNNNSTTHLGKTHTYAEVFWSVFIYQTTFIDTRRGWCQWYEHISDGSAINMTKLELTNNAGNTANVLRSWVNNLQRDDGTTELPLGEFFNLEARVKFDNTSAGEFQVWINGVEEFNLTGVTQPGATSWNTLYPVMLYGQNADPPNIMGEAVMYWDDLIIADERIWTLKGYGGGGGGAVKGERIISFGGARRVVRFT